jgi:DUF1009 family protein
MELCAGAIEVSSAIAAEPLDVADVVVAHDPSIAAIEQAEPRPGVTSPVVGSG